jgi:hypothetical protein
MTLEPFTVHLLYVIEIFIACVFAFIAERWWVSYKSRKLDIGCDFCKKAIPLNKTPDKSAYLCRNCMKAFLAEHEGKFTSEQIAKIMKGYRRRKRRKT